MSILRLAVDRRLRTLVDIGGTPTAIPPLFQSNVTQIEVCVVSPPEFINSAYTKLDMSAFGLRIAVGDTPTGTAGGPTPMALQDTFTWDATHRVFTGQLALNTAAVDSYLGALASRQAYFEINLTSGGGRETIFQSTFTLKAILDEIGSVAPGPEDQYLTAAEIEALYALAAPANASYKFVNGNIYLWDAAAYAADNTKPWRALACNAGNLYLGPPSA